MDLLDNGQHDEELASLQSNIQALVETSKKQLKEKKQAQKKKEVESKKKEEDAMYAAEYAYTPKEGFNWDNVSGSVNDII